MAEDEAVRDLKRHIDNHTTAPPRLVAVSSLPQMVEPLHPDIGRPSSIAQPGGFRRHHILRTGSDSNAAAQNPISLNLLLDPRLLRSFQPPGGSSAAFLAAEGQDGERPGASNIATALLLLKSTIGGTLILIPGAFKDAGLGSAVIVLLAIGGIEIYCMALLVRCCTSIGGGSYGEIVNRSIGRVGYILVDVSLVLSQLGFVCAEMLYVAKNVNGALLKCGIAFVPSERAILIAQMAVTVPLSWIRQLEYFKWTNVIANITVLTALVTISTFSFADLVEEGPADNIDLVSTGWLMFVGTSVFSFECINFVIPLYEEHAEKETFIPVLSATLWGVILLFIVFGGVNYLAYGEETQPTVTLNLPVNSAVGKIVPFGFALASLLNIPLFLFPATITLEGRVMPQHQPRNARRWTKNGIRTSLVAMCTGISIVGAAKIEAMVALIGSFCCVPLAFIFPAISHYVLCNPGPLGKITDILITILGFVLFFSTSKDAIQQMM